MDVASEIARRLEELSVAEQEQVLRYVVALSPRCTPGEPGAGLRFFSGMLDSQSAEEIRNVIEQECESIDAGEW